MKEEKGSDEEYKEKGDEEVKKYEVLLDVSLSSVFVFFTKLTSFL
jgi:hypothetical protein